ncbi:hypothetical protein GQ44DRAFT_728488 [Phaeosphaeriaceae sp. PMI808]|nr:hypothetical protein GQ44DRAFT_728488 [Phaeosphaeriaceae sp. PMI808]
MVILSEDLEEFFKNFEMELTASTATEPPNIVVEINPTRENVQDELTPTALDASYFSRGIQQQLLRLTRRELRYPSNIKIVGCIEEGIAQEVIEKVASPRWPNWHSLLAEFDTYDRESAAAYLRDDLTWCIKICNVSIYVRERLRRHFTHMVNLQENLPVFLERLGKFAVNANLRYARCIFRDLDARHNVYDNDFGENKSIVCEAYTARAFTLAYQNLDEELFGYELAKHGQAEAMYMTAKAVRIMYERESDDVSRAMSNATKYITDAATLWPDNRAKRIELWVQNEKKKIVDQWNNDQSVWRCRSRKSTIFDHRL